jgi:signal transduction histidine kinase
MQEGDEMISGGVLRLFSLSRFGFYLFLLVSYATAHPPLPPGRLPLVVGLILALAVIGVVLSRGPWDRRAAHGLVGVEIALTFALGILVQARGLFAILYLIPAAEAAFVSARPMPVIATCYALLGITLALATPGSFFWAVAGPLLGYAPGFTAIASLSLLVAEHDRARRMLAVAHQRLAETHRDLQHHAVQVEQMAVVRERARLAQEIHDTVAHALTGIIVQVDAARRLMSEQPARAVEALDHVEGLARRGLDEIRSAVRAVRPEALEAAGGLAALRRLAQDFQKISGIAVILATEGPVRPLPAAAEVVLYRAFQEALTNTARHGRAHRVEATLRYTGDAVELRVADDGAGSEASVPGAGLAGIAERAESLGGRARCGARAGGGFQVTVFVPAAAGDVPADRPLRADETDR